MLCINLSVNYMLIYLMRFKIYKDMPKQNVVSVFRAIHLSHNNSINPVITDMNQSVLVDIRLFLGLPKLIPKI